jgi:hypothetical protein
MNRRRGSAAGISITYNQTRQSSGGDPDPDTILAEFASISAKKLFAVSLAAIDAVPVGGPIARDEGALGESRDLRVRGQTTTVDLNELLRVHVLRRGRLWR